MRMMLKVTIPTEEGNRTIEDGSFLETMNNLIEKLKKPEGCYFLADNGCRCVMLFFDMQDVSEIPIIAEPLFTGFNARIEFLPVMNRDDLKKGLAAAAG